jgi:cell division initiation protein
VRITPQDIHRQEFNRSVRGYAVEEVDAFLERVADELERVHQDNTKLRDQLKGLEASLAEYRRMEKNIEKTLMAATQASEDMTKNAEDRRDLIVKEAELRAEEVIAEAQRRRDEIKGEITSLGQQRTTYITEMRAFLQAQLNLLDELELRGFKGPPRAPAREEPVELDLENPGGPDRAPQGR